MLLPAELELAATGWRTLCVRTCSFWGGAGALRFGMLWAHFRRGGRGDLGSRRALRGGLGGRLRGGGCVVGGLRAI